MDNITNELELELLQNVSNIIFNGNIVDNDVLCRHCREEIYNIHYGVSIYTTYKLVKVKELIVNIKFRPIEELKPEDYNYIFYKPLIKGGKEIKLKEVKSFHELID